MAKSIESIEGIGHVFGNKLKAIGCGSPAKLLKDGGTPKGRKEIAAKTDISPKVILRCVNMADLFRIKGVASQFAELLEASGVDTVKELKHRRADNLSAKMKEVNDTKKLTRVTPSETVVQGWIDQAKNLPSMISY
jgi:hypothetical protein